MNDTTLAPHSDYFVATSTADWAAFTAAYADGFDDLLDADDDLLQAVPVPASGGTPSARGVAPRRSRVERSRPLALAF